MVPVPKVQSRIIFLTTAARILQQKLANSWGRLASEILRSWVAAIIASESRICINRLESCQRLHQLENAKREFADGPGGPSAGAAGSSTWNSVGNRALRGLGDLGLLIVEH